MLESLEHRVLFSTVLTDKSDYAFGSTALIHGADFTPGEMIQLQVVHADGTPGSNLDSQNLPWLAQADNSGGLDTNWIVNDPDARGATYVLSAKGMSSGETAQTTFTDAFPAPVNLGNNKNQTAGTSLAVNVSAAVSVGSTVLVAVAMDPNAGAVTATDAKGNVYTLDADVTNGSGTSGVRTLIFSAPVTTALASNDSVTVTFGTSTTAKAMQVSSVSGLLSASRVDKVKTATGSTAAVTTGNTATTTQGDEMLFSVIGNEEKNTPTKGSTYTLVGGTNTNSGMGSANMGVMSQYKTVSATGAYAADGTASGNWAAAVVSYKMAIPTVTAIDRSSAANTSASSVSWNVTFSRAVTGVSDSSFQLATTGGITGALITGVSANSGTSYTVTANSGTGSGTLGLNLVDIDGIADAITGLGLGGTGNNNGDFTGQIYNVTKINAAPTLDTISDVTISEDAGLQTVNLAGIGAGLNESGQVLTITATSSNPSLVPHPAVNYTSPNATGSLSFTPAANLSGSAVITVTITDDGGTAGGGVNTLVRMFTVNVNAVNDLPSVGAINPIVTVNEGATANNSGTFGDIDSASVAITSSVGSITQDAGTWSWSMNTVDGPVQSQVVTITATDIDGGISTTTFNLVVNNVAPTVTIVGAPESSVEGSLVSLSAGPISDIGANDTHTLGWSVTKNGNAFASGSGTSFEFTPNDNGSYVVTLTVTDKDGGVGTDVKTITVTNVDPVAGITGAPVSSPEGTLISLGSSVSDAGLADTHSYNWSVTRNGENFAAGTAASFDFTPTDNGSYVVTLTVTDNDGGIATDTKTIDVSNVDPAASILGAPATSNEGAEIQLTSSVVDPSVDTFSYLWTVTKNGESFASGTDAGINFTPDDNGSYVVTLTVTDNDGGIGSDTKTITVENLAPVATISGAPLTSPEGTLISLTSGITDAGSLDTHSYGWTVTKNGEAFASGNEAGFSFTPDDNGSYVVTLTVTDNDGGVASDVNTITVENVAPVASILGAPEMSDEGTPIALDAGFVEAGSLDSVTYAWSVTKNGLDYATGDGSDFNFTPDDEGSYVVTLTVTDNDGGVGSDTKTITVNNVAPVISILGASESSDEGTLIALSAGLTDAGSLDVHSYGWLVTKNGVDFATGTDSSLNFTPDDNGIYVVTLTVTDNSGAIGSDTKTIAVNNVGPVVTIVDAPASSDEAGLISLTSTFSDVGSSDFAMERLWTVTKNGLAYATGTDADFSFTPDDNGSYVVTLTVTDNDGAIGSDAKTITVNNIAPVASIVGAPESGDEGTAISLTSTVSDASALDTMSYLWTVTRNGVDYATGTDASFELNPGLSGSYVVTLTVTDDDGGIGSDTKTITINNVAPIASISGAPESSLEGQLIALTSSVTDAGSLNTFTYSWNVTKNGADYASGSDSTLNLTPDDNGSYVVTLTVTDSDGAIATDTKIIDVTNTAPSALISGAPALTVRGAALSLASVCSDASLLDSLTCGWTVTKNGSPFASGSDLTCDFTPDEIGSYVVTLTVTDKDGAISSDTKTIMVENNGPTAVITGAPAMHNEGSALSLGAIGNDSDSMDTLTYAWNVTRNGVAYASGAGETLEFTPADNGSYVVTLTVTDGQGGVGSDVKTITVKNVNPAATISGAPVSATEGSLVSLTGSATDAGTLDTLTLGWSVTHNGDDFASGTGSNFSFTPTDNGAYVVTLTVLDGNGGVGSDTAVITVTNVAPTASINGAPASVDAQTGIDLTSSVSDAGSADTLSYAWTVTRNGVAYTSGSEATFSFTPGNGGTYVVSLTVSDDDGAIASDTKTISVNSLAPVASLNSSSTAKIGQALGLDLTGDAASYTIVWGDGFSRGLSHNGNGAAHSNHVFSGEGTFTINVLSTNDIGETVIVATKTVTVSGMNSGVVLAEDPAAPGSTAMFITGSNGNDAISVKSINGKLVVKMNGKLQGPLGGYSGVNGKIYVLGQAGNDNITVDATVSHSVVLIGGIGNDKLTAKGAGNHILLGQDGNDVLTSGNGRDMLIGGMGKDTLKAGNNDDILIAGTTSYDHLAGKANEADLVSLGSIMAEWTSGNTYSSRVGHLTGSDNTGDVFNNGTLIRAGVEVLGDGTVADVLAGDTVKERAKGTKNLWFANFAGANGKKDVVTGISTAETRLPTA